MPSGFPGSIDNFTDPLSNSSLSSPSHSGLHSDVNDAIEKIETYALDLPRGRRASVTSTSTQSVGGGADQDITSLTTTVSLVNNRAYLAIVTITCSNPGAGTGVLNFRVNYGGTNTTYQSIAIPSTNTGNVTFVGNFYFVATATASTTVKVTGYAISQAVGLSGGTNTHRLTLLDIGL